MSFEGGSDDKRPKKASVDSDSDSEVKIPKNAPYKGFKKRNLEGGEGSGDSTKKNLLDPRFSKGEILRENTKKSGLKKFKEDSKKSSRKNKSGSEKTKDGGSKKSSKG